MVDKPAPSDITVEGQKPIGFGGLEIEVNLFYIYLN